VPCWQLTEEGVADPDSSAIAPSDDGRLRNTGGYVPQSWTKARPQLRSTSGLMDALVGNSRPVVLAYGQFLRMYEHMQTRLEIELDHAHGRRSGPAMMKFHAQLAWRNWLVTQLYSSERSNVNPPYFCQGMSMLESQNNLMWLPTVTNVPALLALRATPRGGSSRRRSQSCFGLCGTQCCISQSCCSVVHCWSGACSP
jgi:hypothetical protein